MNADLLPPGGSPTPPVLRSKITAPAASASPMRGVACAPDFVDDGVSVVVAVAPAGYGKTTLLASLASATDLVAWVSVDRRDNDPTRFWIHVAAALASLDVDVTALRAALRFGYADAVDQLVAVVEADGRALRLVLDDVHELVDSELTQQCAALVSRPPANLTVLCASRTELDWPVERLRARGTLVRVDAEQLSMRGQTGVDVFAGEIAAGLLDADTALHIVHLLDGWPAGLRLAQLAIMARGDVGDVRSIAAGDAPSVSRYLAGEVLAGRAADEQEFLLATSVLEVLAPGACDAVALRPGSLATLRRLVSDGVFTVVSDPAGPHFTYHRVLRDFLHSRLAERGDAEVRAVHERAFNYFVSVDDVGAAVPHGVAAERFDRVLDVLSTKYIELANDGRVNELWEWVETIGAEHVLGHPTLSSAPAWASLNLGRYDEIEPWLESFELLDSVSEPHRRDFDLHAMALRCHRDRHLGHLDASVEGADRIIVDAPAVSDHLIGSTAFAAAGAALALAGRHDAARDALIASLEEAQRSGERSSVVLAYSYLGLVADDDDDALAHADSALAEVTTDELLAFHQPSVAWAVRGRVLAHRGHVVEAAAALDQAVALATTAREPLVVALANVEVARLHHLRGNERECREVLRSSEEALSGAAGIDWLREQVRSAHAETRFAPTDDRHLPVGARDLTERELDVLRLLPFQLSRRELAAQLFVSENTIKTHLTSIRHKLLVSDRSDMVARARELGLLPAVE